jgi:hypothetical protein
METTEDITMPQICEDFGITLELKPTKTPRNASKWQKEANSWLAVLEMDGYYMATPFYTGKGLTRDITVADVVHALASDWDTYRMCQTLKGFGDHFGWDEETATTWELITHNAHEFEYFVGNNSILEMMAGVEY